MQLNLLPETIAWLEVQVREGQFATYEDAINYSVKLTSLRETLLASLADPRRFSADEVRNNLKEHFSRRHTETGNL